MALYNKVVPHEQWLEAIAMIPRMWSAEEYSHQGRFFNIPPIRIVPKPVQKPHPPMFAACSQPERAVAIGKMGMGALNMAMYHDELLAERIRSYRAAIAEADPIGFGVTNHFACNPATLVLKDDRRACQYGLAGASYFNKTLLHYYGSDRPNGSAGVAPDEVPETDLCGFRQYRNTPRSQLSSIIGDPVAARESVRRFVDVGVDELILVMQTGPTPHEVVMESIRTFADDVMSHFA